jgi:putative membrane protein
MIEPLLLIVAGTLAGSLTGMIPGIHPNTVIFTFLPIYFIFRPDFILFMSFIAGMGVSHTLHDFLPALFLKAPESDNALASLPGLEMVANGEGRKAFTLTLIGGLTSVCVFILSIPLMAIIIPSIYPFLESIMLYILLFFLFFIILESKSRVKAVIVAALSGTLGIVTLNSGFRQQFILMPIFAGLFAVPAVLYSLKNKVEIPEQKDKYRISFKEIEAGGTGFLAGILAGIVPGIGAAISTTFLTPLMDSEDSSFITGLGGVNTSDILISFLALYLIGRPRAGSSVALKTVSSVGVADAGFMIGASIFASGIAGILALKNLDLFLLIVKKIDFKWLGLTTLGVISLVVWFTTGFYGFLIMGTSAFIGGLALISNCWAASMSVLIVPALTYYSGGFI